MSNEDLKPMLPDPPPPSQEGRRTAIESALAAYDEEFSKSRQESDGRARLTSRTGHGPGRNTGATIMKQRWAIAASLLLATGLVGGGFYLDQHHEPFEHLLSRAIMEGDARELKEEAAPPAMPTAIPAERAAAARRLAEQQSRQQFQPQSLAQAYGAADAVRQAAAESRARTAASPTAASTMAAERIMPPEHGSVGLEPHGRDRFPGAAENPFRVVAEHPVSTFSIDVDTASYSFVRASLNRNVLPPKDAVRTEELVNYFPYAYPAPDGAREPFKTTVSVLPSPWTEGRQLVHIGIRGYAVRPAERPRANLVFLIDTSGSMNAPNRLPLVKQSLAMLLDQLDARDKIAIVAYAGSAGTILDPTAASEKAKILGAIERLGAGGSTAGAEGIRQAYALAEANYDADGVNRIILATDGDFNVGITSQDELKGFVERKREKGIFLSVLGFGMGNYNDAMMQALAQNGNGTAAYIDTLAEARKTLIEEATSTIIPIAKDVKIQVEFNPARVAEYRLVGYETRILRREDFNNDKVDAGDVGSGHMVTAIYEVVPDGAARVNSDLRYRQAQRASASPRDELGFIAMRYKLPTSDTSELVSTPIPTGPVERFENAPQEARFAVSVAGFAELLRGGRHTGRLTYDDVIRTASQAKGEDPFGYRSEFIQLVRAAKAAAALQALPR